MTQYPVLVERSRVRRHGRAVEELLPLDRHSDVRGRYHVRAVVSDDELREVRGC